ncbi:GNAT family N-acetyltransferase [Actinomadura parmotrematis]|uniref:GNAT family N-acetyltransferase n=1 Tax=Actinomadura parmotrematis TaxID=2864039 RepID=A0ABS7FS45_9ACTN|nr:GNAT family protein [Actinomadura parmotrematis]MBW8483230.1 GNAT family N-acetyltransferase [Actinomadura parmotrematis]
MTEVLRTGRLALHPLGAGDHAELLAHWTGPVVRRHLFDDLLVSAEEISEIIAGSERDFRVEGYGLWALRWAPGEGPDDAPAGELIGVAGLRGHHGTGGPDGADAEIVYSLEPARWGQGLAAEAAAAVLDYAFDVLGLRGVTAEVDAAGTVSAEVARAVGMTARRSDPDGTAHYAAHRGSWHGSRRPVHA